MNIPRLFFFPLILCLFLRLAFFACVHPWNPLTTEMLIHSAHSGDSSTYHALAVNLKNEHRFSTEKNGSPEVYRTPTYPLFIGLSYSLFGERWWTAVLSQIVLEGVTLSILFLTLSRVLGSRETLFAVFFYAADPFLILYSNRLVSETFFIFLCVIFFYFFTSAVFGNFIEKPKGRFFLSGFFLGLAALTRPSAQFLLVPVSLFLFALFRKNLQKAGATVGVLALGFFLAVSPWMLRNQILFNSPALSTSNSENLLKAYVGPMFLEIKKRGITDPAFKKKSLPEKVDTFIQQKGISPDSLNPMEKSDYWARLAIQYIRQNPSIFLEKFIQGIFHSFMNLESQTFSLMLGFDPGGREFNMIRYESTSELILGWFVQKGGGEMAVGFFILTYLLVSYSFLVLGLVFAWRSKTNKAFFAFGLLVSAYFILIAGPMGLARFRLPAIPFYLCFVGIGMDHVLCFFRKKFTKESITLGKNP